MAFKRTLIVDAIPDGTHKTEIVGVGNLSSTRIFLDFRLTPSKIFRASFPQDWHTWNPVYKMLCEAGYDDETIAEFELSDLVGTKVEIHVASKSKGDCVFCNVTEIVLPDTDEEPDEAEAAD